MAVPPAPPVVPSGPALWKVADEDTSIYLFGTIHALPPEVKWLDVRVEGALAQSDEFVTEVDISRQSEISAGLLNRASLADGQNLRNMLSAEDRPAYEAALATLGLPATFFDRYEPWYAALMLSLIPLMQQGYTASVGAEEVLAGKLSPDTARGALETIEFQLDLFDTLPEESQKAYLHETIQALPALKETLDAMVAEWLEGDVESLATLLHEQETDPLLFEQLIASRNRHWAQWIAERLETPGTVFVAVGAAHLAGPESVQDYLERQGVTSERIP